MNPFLCITGKSLPYLLFPKSKELEMSLGYYIKLKIWSFRQLIILLKPLSLRELRPEGARVAISSVLVCISILWSILWCTSDDWLGIVCLISAVHASEQ